MPEAALDKEYVLAPRGQAPNRNSPSVMAPSLEHAIGLFSDELDLLMDGQWDVLCVPDSELTEIDFSIPAATVEGKTYVPMPGHA